MLERNVVIDIGVWCKDLPTYLRWPRTIENRTKEEDGRKSR